MEVFVFSNRPEGGSGLVDGCVPGPLFWGQATCTETRDAPEGWSWSFENGDGLTRLDRKRLLGQLAARLEPGDRPKALLLHLHGAGSASAHMFCRAANLARIYGGDDLEIVPVLLSWACGGFTPDDYLAARRWIQRDVTEIADAFRAITRVAAGRKPGVRAFVTAHSLGNHLLSRILADCAARGEEPAEADRIFDDTLLLAADVDNNALDARNPPPGSGLHRLDRWTREIHVYFSPADAIVGLGTIGQIALPIPGRSGTALGSSGPVPDLAQTANGTMVDAVNCGFLPAATSGETQHHYWRIDPLAVQDVRAVLRQVPPSRMPWRSPNLFSATWNILPNEVPGA